MSSKKTERIYIRIEPELKEKFKNYLEENGKTISKLINKWIKDELKKAQR